MDESSLEQRRKGRYIKAANRKKKRRAKNITIAAVIVVLLCASLLLISHFPQKGVYRTLCDDGYTGTQEQLIASLVGEETESGGDTAFTLAVENGYRKSKPDWIKTLTGAKTFDEKQTPYQVACANGYEGSLSQWLTHIAENPEALGKIRRWESHQL